MGWDLLSYSWEELKANKRLMVFPILSTLRRALQRWDAILAARRVIRFAWGMATFLIEEDTAPRALRNPRNSSGPLGASSSPSTSAWA